jgi:restriction system protein
MSKASETTLWGIHAGSTGDADTLFKTKNVVAVGWPAMGSMKTFN